MHKNPFSSIALLSMLLLVGAGCLSSGTTSNSENTNAFTGSLSDALDLGQTLQCTWSSDDGEGTSYMKNGSMFAETTYAGVTGNILTDGSCTYIWEEGKTEGIEFCTDEDFSEDIMDSETDVESFADNSIDYDVEVDCQRTNVPDTTFVVPENVEFINPLELFRF